MSTRHPLVFILLVALLGFFIYGAVSVFLDNDEKRIRREINAAILGVELNDPARYSAILAEDFADSQGLTRREILEQVAEIFKDFRPVKVDVKQLKIKVSGAIQATADMGFKVYLRRVKDDVLYQDAGKLVLSFKKVRGVWRAYQIFYTGSEDIWFIQSVA